MESWDIGTRFYSTRGALSLVKRSLGTARKIDEQAMGWRTPAGGDARRPVAITPHGVARAAGTMHGSCLVQSEVEKTTVGGDGGAASAAELPIPS